MFGDYTSGDLFDLVRRGGGGGSTLEVETPTTVSCLRSSPPFKPPLEAHVSQLPLGSPSEDEMTEWLHAIIKGGEEDDACSGGGDRGWTHDNGSWHVLFDQKSSEASVQTQGTLLKKNGKLRTSDDMASKERGSGSRSKTRKKTAGMMRSHHGVTHKLTEKRRRCEIKERFKTLQHLVPGCDKFNYTSTLEHTIQYMKTLQKQVQDQTCRPAPLPVWRWCTLACRRRSVSLRGRWLRLLRWWFLGPHPWFP